MKKNNCSFRYLLSLSGILFICSCAAPYQYSRTGTVQEIERGKDGYTAKLKSAEGEDFDAIFSIPRLQKSYKTLNTGDKVKLSGDTIHLDGKVRILVKAIKP